MLGIKRIKPIKKKWLKQGFETGVIKMPGLDIHIWLKEHVFLRNDGIVPDYMKHAKDVYSEFGFDTSRIPKYESAHIQKMDGNFFNWVYASVIFTEDHGDVNNVYLQGQASTNALLNLTGTRPLLDEMRKLGLETSPVFKDISSGDISSDRIAAYGGLVALYKHGLHKEYRGKANFDEGLEKLIPRSRGICIEF